MEPQDKSSEKARSFNSVYFGASIYAYCLLPFLRHSLGSQAFGASALLALIGMFMAGGLLRLPELLLYLCLWFVALVLQRLGMLRRWFRGEYIHSRYVGDSWLAYLPGISDGMAKAVGEPVFCLIVAATVSAVSIPLAKFIGAGAVALIIKHQVELQLMQARMRQMRDAHIEQTYVAHRFRKGE